MSKKDARLIPKNEFHHIQEKWLAAMWLRLGASDNRKKVWQSVARLLQPLYHLGKILSPEFYDDVTQWTTEGIVADLKGRNLHRPQSCSEENVHDVWIRLNLFSLTGDDGGEVRYDPHTKEMTTKARLLQSVSVQEREKPWSKCNTKPTKEANVLNKGIIRDWTPFYYDQKEHRMRGGGGSTKMKSKNGEDHLVLIKGNSFPVASVAKNTMKLTSIQ